MSDNYNQIIGSKGEDLAAQWLVLQGFDLLHRNWRSGRYELDLVAMHEGELHIIEVKSRKSSGLTTPEDAMTHAKFKALFRAASAYIAYYHIDADTQFDLIAIEFNADGTHSLRYIPNVMTPRW